MANRSQEQSKTPKNQIVPLCRVRPMLGITDLEQFQLVPFSFRLLITGASPTTLCSIVSPTFVAELSMLAKRDGLLRPTVIPYPPSQEMRLPTRRTLGGSTTLTKKIDHKRIEQITS